MKNNILEHLSPIEDIINDAKNGKMYILVDDPGRENEGDLIIPAQMATPEAINFMTKYGRGLVCLSLTKKRIDELELPLMNPSNQKNDLTAFTISIEAKEGITTGISAADRARTISVAINSNTKKYFMERRTTSHWPAPINVNGKQPQLYGDDSKRIDYSKLTEPKLDDIMEEIEKLL